MTLIKQIYNELYELEVLTTDEFSTQWLGQSRSYYTSLNARNIEASTPVLLHLMNELISKKDALLHEQQGVQLKYVAKKYMALAEQVGKEIAERSLKQNLSNRKARAMILRIINEVNESHFPSVPPIIVM